MLLRILLLAISLYPGGTSTKVSPYKVLILGPIGSRSLYHLTRSLSEALGDAGHDITLVSTFGPSLKHPQVTEVPTGAPVESLDIDNVFEKRDIFSVFEWSSYVTQFIGRKMWKNDAIKHLWRRRHEFDAIVMISYGNEIALPFLLEYKGAFITLCTPGVEFFSMATLGNWLPMSVTPSLFLPLDEHMSFLERLINPLATLATRLVYTYKSLPVAQRTVEEFFPDIPPLLQLYESCRLTLINGHFALDGPMPLLPTQVEVGTINAHPAKPLPKDLQVFINDSGDAGVIYFSLGSIVRSNDLPRKFKDMFLDAFRRLPAQRIIWKYEDTDLDLPQNVITRKWLPQQDILGHPKTKIFISHCGNLGTQEAKYHGVPVLAVPVGFDQPRNAARMARKGFGLVLNWDEMTADTIVDALQSLLNNQTYAERLKIVSDALKDQKESPGERAVWWIEYAIRHGQEAFYLDYAGKDLYFLQYIMVDVFSFWIMFFIILTYSFYVLCMKGFKCLCQSKKKECKKKSD